jgi:hypothetical protein
MKKKTYGRRRQLYVEHEWIGVSLNILAEFDNLYYMLSASHQRSQLQS